MPRLARIAPKDHIYHILTRGNNRQAVFGDEKDYMKYLEILQRYKEKYRFKLYHYILMRNHVHLILEPTERGASLSEIMKGINLSYVLYYKARYKHTGHFFQDRYKSIIVSKDSYLLACGSYVELNPVRARIVNNPKDYKWSSYNVYAYGKRDRLIEEHPIYKELAKDEMKRRKKYRELVKGMQRKNEAMKGEMQGKVVYGNADFVKKITKKYDIDATIKSKGRPRKIGNEDK